MNGVAVSQIAYSSGTELFQDKALLCPSAQPTMSNSRVFAVVGGPAQTPEVAYLNETLPVTKSLLAMAEPVLATEVFRFAADCEKNACCHFDGSRCLLATRIIQILPAVTEGLPACRIRSTCRWFEQEGREACLRCPQIVTQVFQPSRDMQLAASGLPEVKREP